MVMPNDYIVLFVLFTFLFYLMFHIMCVRLLHE